METLSRHKPKSEEELRCLEGKLIKILIDKRSLWAVFEGMIDGKYSFMSQGYQKGYPVFRVNSLMRGGQFLEFNDHGIELNIPHLTWDYCERGMREYREKVSKLKDAGIWEEPLN